MTEPPQLDAFLQSPIDDVRAIMPETVIFTPGGTRRDAALHGIAPDSHAYAEWSRQRMIACVALLFHYGARHVLLTAMWPRQFAESGAYRERTLGWLRRGLAGPAAQEDYQRLGCRTRLVSSSDSPEAAELAAAMEQAASAAAPRTIWWAYNEQPGDMWQHMLRVSQAAGAQTQAELIRALYGEAVPLAGLWLSFGKPMISPDLAPLALMGETACYWLQRPGYTLDEPTLRRILYDARHTRRTWMVDKTERASGVERHRAEWASAGVLGVGRRLGSYWYPATQESTRPSEVGAPHED